MRKKALLALMLVLTLLLSGCTLIVKDQAMDNATEIIRMGDRVVTKKEVKEQVDSVLQYNEYMYSMMGQSYDVTDPQVIASAQEEAIDDLKKDLTLTAKAKELGLDQLTAEEEETVKTKAQEDYDSAVEYVKTNELAGAGLEGEELDKAVTDYLVAREVTLDAYTESERKTVIAAANNGTTLYYTPAGVRRVKQILIKFKEEDQTAIDEAQKRVTDANTAVTTAEAKVTAAQSTLEIDGIDEETETQAKSDLEAANKELEEASKELEEANKAVTDATEKAFENITAEADEVLASVKAEGADWQAIMDEKNQDPGMKNNEKGYAVAAGMTNFDSAFVDAAMALAKPGDISDKVRGTSYGYYIIRYESDEAEGATPLDDVKETISSALLSTKQNEVYNTTVNQWVEEAGIKVDLNALKD